MSYYLPRTQAHELRQGELKKCHKSIKKRIKDDKKGKYIKVPGIEPEFRVFILNKDLVNKGKTNEILEQAKQKYLKNRLTKEIQLPMKNNYEYFIAKAEHAWFYGENKKAIEYYELALKEKQVGKISKKAIKENIKELKKEY